MLNTEKWQKSFRGMSETYPITFNTFSPLMKNILDINFVTSVL
jgi:hypothetical protein